MDPLSTSWQTPGFRPSINGLRGIAILWVVLFHWCHVLGGFTGVDIFFVISGYLISGHIVRELSKGEFSFWGFYAKRARRIFPSLVVILLFVFMVGQRYSLTEDFIAIGKHIRAGALFFTNFQLFTEAGYFDGASESKPLLHLWSLSVEEQFYLIWPVLLFLANRFLKRTIPFAIAVVLISFGMNLFWHYSERSSQDFYFLPSRFWELGVGYLVFESQTRFRKFYDGWFTQTLAFGLLVLSAIAIRSDGFPGWKAILPVMGSALLIGGSENAMVNRYLLSSKFLGFFGTLSFVLYLWHWPLFSFMKTLFLEDQMVTLVVSTLVLSFLSHRFVEKPMMSLRVTPENRKKMVMLGSGALLFFAMLGTLLANGVIPSRMASAGLTLAMSPRTVPSCMQDMDGRKAFSAADLAPCMQIKFPGRPVVLLIGDSHSNSLQAGLQPFLESHQINSVTLSAAFCSPFSLKDKSEACVNFNRYAMDWAKENKPDLVLISTYYLNWQRPNQYYRESAPYYDFVIDRALAFQKSTGKKVLLLGQNPTWIGTLPRVVSIAFLMRGLPVPLRTLIGQDHESLVADDIEKGKAQAVGIPFYSMKDAVCNSEGCLVRSGENPTSDLMTTDYGHISPAGATYVTEHGLGGKVLELLSRERENTEQK